MNIIGFSGSPRKEGNTAWAIDTILDGAKAKGANTQSFHFSDLTIAPCKSCYACKKSDKGCVINDDMQQVYSALKKADALVFGTPVYMGQMSAQAKIFCDRLYAMFMPRFSPFFKEENTGKKMILVFTQGNPDAGKFQVYIDYTKAVFQMIEFDVAGVHVITNTRSKPAHEREDLICELRGAGEGLMVNDE